MWLNVYQTFVFRVSNGKLAHFFGSFGVVRVVVVTLGVVVDVPLGVVHQSIS